MKPTLTKGQRERLPGHGDAESLKQDLRLVFQRSGGDIYALGTTLRRQGRTDLDVFLSDLRLVLDDVSMALFDETLYPFPEPKEA